jgi:hypothetical protein
MHDRNCTPLVSGSIPAPRPSAGMLLTTHCCLAPTLSVRVCVCTYSFNCQCEGGAAIVPNVFAVDVNHVFLHRAGTQRGDGINISR